MGLWWIRLPFRIGCLGIFFAYQFLQFNATQYNWEVLGENGTKIISSSKNIMKPTHRMLWFFFTCPDFAILLWDPSWSSFGTSGCINHLNLDVILYTHLRGLSAESSELSCTLPPNHKEGILFVNCSSVVGTSRAKSSGFRKFSLVHCTYGPQIANGTSREGIHLSESHQEYDRSHDVVF